MPPVARLSLIRSHISPPNLDNELNMAPHIPYRLDGKVALVTGSGRGIGAAMAIELGRCGANVIVNYANSRDSAEKLVDEIKALGTDAIALKANIRNVPEIVKLMDEAVAHFGGLDIVCSNAGVVSFQHLGDVTEVHFLFFSFFFIIVRANEIPLNKGGIRPRLLTEYARPILRCERGLSPSEQRRTDCPHVLQHSQGIQRPPARRVLRLQGCH